MKPQEISIGNGMKLILQEGLLTSFNATIPWNMMALGQDGIEINIDDCQLTFSIDFDILSPLDQVEIEKQKDMVSEILFLTVKYVMIMNSIVIIMH